MQYILRPLLHNLLLPTWVSGHVTLVHLQVYLLSSFACKNRWRGLNEWPLSVSFVCFSRDWMYCWNQVVSHARLILLLLIVPRGQKKKKKKFKCWAVPPKDVIVDCEVRVGARSTDSAVFRSIRRNLCFGLHRRYKYPTGCFKLTPPCATSALHFCGAM